MPPKTVFDRSAILEAALAIAQETGISSITTRNVAKRLGSSVAPIYLNFETVDHLIDAVVERVMESSLDLLAKQKGSSTFEKIGLASLAFARKYPVIFRELTLEPNKYMASYDAVETQILSSMAEDETMKEWSIQERRRLLFKMRAFQIGLSVLTSTDQKPTWLSDDEMEEILLETGQEIISVAMKKKEREGK
ncbi:TetR family transcriptional regulator [Proteiniclasticum ruminis]|uniref:Regulatory protein, tetR family n=1 Tax=Proteiniclasticum ruminis TaxID=398199 RepID=A0A1I5E2W9_9CLOT|nr:TetR family transcriptional regulator [Proteiniclasticum ruminis]SFO05600.1 regulatory protein, tetR family [Proteiniclasticum ruminis]